MVKVNINMNTKFRLPLLLLKVLWIFVVGVQLSDDVVVPVALCMAQCPSEQCRQACNKSINNNTKVTFTQTEAGSNATLQCKDVDRIVLRHNPGIYVIEQIDRESNKWQSPIISRKNFYRFRSLKPNSSYQYRIRKVTPEGISLPETTQWFWTNAENYTPAEVKNITMSQIEKNEKQTNKLQVFLNIVPADDLNCLYTIIHWGERHDVYQYSLDVLQEYRLKLTHLKYNRNNIVYVISRNEVGLLESKNVTLTFITPSCLEVHNSLRVCPPPPVTKLQIINIQSNEQSLDFEISWDEPLLQPDNYTVIIDPLDAKNNSKELTFPGNTSSISIPNVVLNRHYEIGVLANSEGGSSSKWTIFTKAEQSMGGTQVIVAIATPTTLVVLLILAYTYCRYKHFIEHVCQYSFFENLNKKRYAFEDIRSTLKSSTYDTMDSKPRDKFEIQFNRLIIKKVLGSGSSGVVKLATLYDEQKKVIDVAVKMLREDASPDDVRNFHHEILLMKSAGSHRNIVALIGCCTLGKEQLLVVEYCNKGDLQTYLRTILEEMMREIFKRAESSATTEVSPFLQQKTGSGRCTINNKLYDIQGAVVENKITAEDLLKFALQVANGMEFLSLNRIVHRDLAARNVLVCADQTVKISDFGLSRDIYQINMYKKQSDSKLPLKWIAIEALTHQVYTTHSDVWSFGILLYEIITLGGNPYPDLQSSQILHLLKSGYRMERPSNCGLQLYEIMRSCWHENPLNRPTFTQLKHQLDRLLTTITKNEYLNLSEFLHEPTHGQNLRMIGRRTENILTIPNIT